MHIINQLMYHESKRPANLNDLLNLSDKEALFTDKESEIMPLISEFIKLKNNKVIFETPIIETDTLEVVSIIDNKIFTKENILISIPLSEAKKAFVFDNYLKISLKEYDITLW